LPLTFASKRIIQAPPTSTPVVVASQSTPMLSETPHIARPAVDVVSVPEHAASDVTSPPVRQLGAAT